MRHHFWHKPLYSDAHRPRLLDSKLQYNILEMLTVEACRRIQRLQVLEKSKLLLLSTTTYNHLQKKCLTLKISIKHINLHKFEQFDVNRQPQVALCTINHAFQKRDIPADLKLAHRYIGQERYTCLTATKYLIPKRLP